ncbi:MAG: cytochrome c family protein [Sulfurimonas sp.]|nr:cytochrome c family protein [Sulfurimonas sp.]
MLKIFFIILLFLLVDLSANQRVIDELESPMPQIPLKSALGDKAYDDAIGSGKYRYVSSSKCRLCHRKFFRGRKKDPHDRAMENLVATKHENNPHCLTCHSTGYGVKNGFVNMAQTPHLANVQCEGCHGPGSVHVKMAKAKFRNREKFKKGGFLAGQDNPQILKKMCTSCHTKRWDKSYHDLDEAYNSYKKANPNAKYK